jgi:hypothetical protein
LAWHKYEKRAKVILSTASSVCNRLHVYGFDLIGHGFHIVPSQQCGLPGMDSLGPWLVSECPGYPARQCGVSTGVRTHVIRVA